MEYITYEIYAINKSFLNRDWCYKQIARNADEFLQGWLLFDGGVESGKVFISEEDELDMSYFLKQRWISAAAVHARSQPDVWTATF